MFKPNIEGLDLNAAQKQVRSIISRVAEKGTDLKVWEHNRSFKGGMISWGIMLCASDSYGSAQIPVMVAVTVDRQRIEIAAHVSLGKGTTFGLSCEPTESSIADLEFYFERTVAPQ
jgi:hypothetical protein